MEILVTGGTGFIGRHVVAEAQRRGHRVRVLARRGPSPHPDVPLTTADLSTGADLNSALDVDAVIHCAAAMGGNAASQHAATVTGTANLLAAMERRGIRRLVSLSSISVYDYRAIATGSVLDEDAPIEADLGARAPYIRAKVEQEAMVRERGTAAAWHVVVVRPGLVYGPKRTWFHHLGLRLGDRLWLMPAPDGALPLIEVGSCSAAIVAALDAAPNALLNLVDDALPSRREYLAHLAGTDASRPARIGLPWSLVSAAAHTAGALDRLAGGRLPLPGLLQPADLAARCKPLVYANARARAALAWTPRSEWREALSAALRSA